MREELISEAPLIEAVGLSKRYRAPAARLFERASGIWGLGDANGGTVDFAVRRGESVAIVGESGSGKSTLLGMMLGLGTPTTGEVRFDDALVFPRRRNDRMLWLRRRTGIVFQDPYSSFNPRRTIGQTVAEPLVATGAPGAVSYTHLDVYKRQILRTHLLPNAAPVFTVQLSLSMGLAILAEAGLSYLGFGAPPGVPSWGRMLAETQAYIAIHPLVVLWPGLAITVTVLAFYLLGDACLLYTSRCV